MTEGIGFNHPPVIQDTVNLATSKSEKTQIRDKIGKSSDNSILTSLENLLNTVLKTFGLNQTKLKLIENSQYTGTLNELIRLSKPSDPDLRQKCASCEFRKLLAQQLDKIKSENRLTQGAKVEDVLIELLNNVIQADGNTNSINSLLIALNTVKENPQASNELKQTLNQFFEKAAQLNQDRMRGLGPSRAERDTQRTPVDVLTNLIAELDTMDKGNPHIAECLQEAKAAWLAHNWNLDTVKNLLQKAKLHSDPTLTKLCDQLLGQLPQSASQLAAAQKHENIYGRAFDSAFVAKLVETPPQSVMQSMNTSGAALADFVDKLNAKQKKFIVKELQKKLSNEGDARFWFPKVGAMAAIRDAKTPEEGYAALTKFLRSDCQNGYDVIARPYIMTKISLALVDARDKGVQFEEPNEVFDPNWPQERKEDFNRLCKEMKERNVKKGWESVPWMQRANENYARYINPKKGIVQDKGFLGNDLRRNKVGGITLQHQPAMIRGEWMEPTSRPVMRNLANLEMMHAGSDEQARPMQLAEERGLAWVSGISGSTNILLHQLAFFKNELGINIDPKPFLLASLMFLVYDGGHSMQEILFVANQLDASLGLNLGLSIPGENPINFVADYSKLAQLSPGADGAVSDAMTDLIGYFHKNSHYSSKA